MESISAYSPTFTPHHRDVVSLPKRDQLYISTNSKPNLFRNPLSSSNLFTSRGLRPRPVVTASSFSTSSTRSYDVVIIGAGIIGLTIARQLLLGSDLSVAVVDKALPCSGATGAGQGYIWMVHKSPESDKWPLSMRSRQLWEEFAESLKELGQDPLHELGWKKTGSLLVGRTVEESDALRNQVLKLRGAGLKAEFLDGGALHLEEPELVLGEEGGAAFLPDDCQLDAQQAVGFIQKANRMFASKGRYAEFFNEPVMGLLRHGSSGDIEAVRTTTNTLYTNKAVVFAAGCWSGSLMHDLFRNSDVDLDFPVKPRKGHLLVLENFCSLNLRHGLMEAGYVNHEHIIRDLDDSSSLPVNDEQLLSVSMTATLDTTGNLVLGSSRQFSGFSTEIEESIINHIWKRARDFFPKLKESSIENISACGKVRVGLRPYMPDGKPVIGHLPALPNGFIAAGHEGEGLCMALGTAEMIANMVLGRPGIIDTSAFAFQGQRS